MRKICIVGIDEVGRGAIAGPVEVAAVAVFGLRIPARLGRLPLRDSKRLTPNGREAWYGWIKRKEKEGKGLRSFSSRVYPRRIDRTDISSAANEAAGRLFKKIGDLGAEMRIYLDGGLYVRNPEYQRTVSRDPGRKCSLKTVIRGDEKIAAIKLASIVAKVERDRYMRKQDGKYRGYDFSRHKGYGTRDHFSAVRGRGVCRLHRLTFVRQENIIGR